MKHLTEDDQNVNLYFPRWELSTGKTVAAHSDILGIGSDGIVYCGEDDRVETEKLTAEERREMAEYMMQRWAAFGGLQLVIARVHPREPVLLPAHQLVFTPHR